jgi:hypothetical protein
MGRPVQCSNCCRTSHSRLPFHRVEQWTGEFFKPAWLRDVGVQIRLGHEGSPCPLEAENNPFEDFADMAVDYDDESDWEDGEEAAEEPPPLAAFINSVDPIDLSAKATTMMCVVDRSGIHHLPVQWCRCPGHASDGHQLFSMGLFPSSFKRIRTAFTFQVLDDFRIDNLECKTSANNFYRKLRRITSNAFPNSIKVCRHIISTSDIP